MTAHRDNSRLAAALCVLLAIGAALVAWLAPGALVRFLNREHFIALFLVMAGGYLLGAIQIRSLQLGPTAGALLVAIFLSYWAVARYGISFELPPFASSLFFNLFMFAVGMKVGPQVLPGLDRGAKQYILLAVLVPLAGAGLALALKALMHPPTGAMVGLFAGANTATPALAAATAAFEARGVSAPGGPDTPTVLLDMSAAFGCSYCVSSVLFVVYVKLLPSLFKLAPADDARTFEQEMSSGTAPLPGANADILAGTVPVQHRTYVVEHPTFAGKSIETLKREQPFLAIEHVRRAGRDVPPNADTVLELGDHVRVFSRIPLLIAAGGQLGPEVFDESAATSPLETVEVVQRNPAVVGQRLVDLVQDAGHGLFLNAMFRRGEEIPQGSEVTIQKGDVLRVTGTAERIAQLESRFGAVVRPSLSTDILTLALGLSLGAALGVVIVPLGKVDFTLGSLALLLVGIGFSTLRTKNPALGGPFPEAARQLLEDLGLNVFVVILGLGMGPALMRAIELGAFLPLLAASLVVGLVPPLLAWLLGLYVMKLNSAELLGAVSGARCSGSALRSAQEVSQSTVPAIAYPITYALSSLLFTLLAYVLVMLE